MTYIEKVEGTITHSDGTETKFLLDPDTGWHQWGGTNEQLGRNVNLLDALFPAAVGHMQPDEDEEELDEDGED